MRILIICLLTCLIWLPTARAASSEDILVVSNTLPPLKFESDGMAHGIMVDVLIEVLQANGVDFDPADVKTMPWARAYEDARHIPGTILLSLARTPDRAGLFKWVGPVYSIQLGLIGKINRPYVIEQATDAEGYAVGTLRDTAPEQLLFKQGFSPEKAHRVARTEQGLRMLAQGRLDFFAHTADSSFFMMPELGMDPTKYKVYYVIQDVDLYLGLNNSFSDEFVARLQAAFEALKQPGPDGISRYDEIIRQYVPLR